MSYTTIRNPAAMLVGVAFTLLTLYVLLVDVVQHGAAFTTRHAMTLGVLCGTIFFGHTFWQEARSWRLGNALGCAILFLAGTTTCVLLAAGRNAEAVQSHILTATSANTARQDAQNDRQEAKTRYDAALKAEEQECSSGSGAKCEAKRITRQLRREDFDGADKKLRAQQPEQVANGDIRAAAELIARVPYVTAPADRVEALLSLLFPFLLSLFCEVGAIVGYSIALGHRQLPSIANKSPAIMSKPFVTYRLPARLPVTSDQQLVLDALDRAGRPVSNEELAKLVGCSEGEMSKKVAALSAVLRKEKDGKRVAISRK